ncbi:MAG: trypsin-like serine peptidase [Saprospiraceae bacterium]
MGLSETLQGLTTRYFSPGEKAKAGIINQICQEAYGTGGRTEFYEVEALLSSLKSELSITDSGNLDDYVAEMKRNIQTVVMVVDMLVLEQCDQPDYVKVKSTPLRERKVSHNFPLCGGIAYGQQRSAHSLGSGFFLEKDMIATAAHVIIRPGLDIESLRFVHGIRITGPNDYRTEIRVHKSQVFKPSSGSLSHQQHYLSEMGSDFAVLKVEPAYEYAASPYVKEVRFPADIKAYNSLFKAESIEGRGVYGVGHGLSLPLKVSYGGRIIHAPKTFPYFETDLNLVGGNSGSPVFDSETHELVGIYVRGTKKLQLKDSGHCLEVKMEHIPSSLNDVEGQECQRLEAVWAAAQWLRQQK